MQEMLSDKIEGIETKVRQLAARLHTLQVTYEQLKLEHKKLKTELIQKNTKLFELEKRTKTLPLTQKKHGTAQLRVKQMKKEIIQYIKEIDKCVEWLKNS